MRLFTNLYRKGAAIMAEMSSMEMWVNQKLEKCQVIIFDTREEADETLSKMNDLLTQEGFVSIAAIREMFDIPRSSSDARWGWDEIKTTVLFKTKRYWVLAWMGYPIPIHTKRKRKA